MGALDQFDNIIDVLKNMPPAEKNKLIEAHKSFGRLRSLCEARGEIEIMPKMTGIKILKWTENTQELKKVKEFLNPAGFQWIEPKKTKRGKKSKDRTVLKEKK